MTAAAPEPAPAPLVAEPAAPLIAIVGATATGKSALADALAQELGAEVMSADSMQVYRGMDIGTAKVPPAERSVAYHGIDLVDPGQAYTAALYQRLARATIADTQARGQRLVFCGGSGLYLRAALDEFDFDQGFDHGPDAAGTDATPGTSASAPTRAQLQEQAAALGPEAFHALLAARDPQSAALIHPHNIRRVVRAFELLQEGTSYSAQTQGFARFTSVYPLVMIGLAVERGLLYQLIGQRVDLMVESGLVDEVRGLAEAGFGQALTAMQAIGYKEMLLYLDGRLTLAEATEQVKQATRRYAKRQGTWFRRDPRVRWIDASELAAARLAGRLASADVTLRLLGLCRDLLQASQGPGAAGSVGEDEGAC